MTTTVDHELSTAMAGTVLVPGSDGYDEARRVRVGGHDARPAVIARCAGTADVVAAVGYAREHGLEIAVRGGGHSPAGFSTVDGGLVVDLGAMNAITVDPAARRVRVGGGALLRDMDAATQEHGLAVPAGEVGHVGVGGLALGGGMGWLTRRFGLTVDVMVSAEVVLADGRVVRASGTENPDLFWALRGGGGNFGVVTEFEFDAFGLGPTISLGVFFYAVDQGADALRLARDTSLPDSVAFQVVAANAPPAPFVPDEVQLRPGWALIVVGTAADTDAEAVHASLRSRGPAPLFEFVTPMPFVELQQMFDEDEFGAHAYETSCHVEELTDSAIEVLARHVAGKPSSCSEVHLYSLTGAYCTADPDATSFGGDRTPRWGVFLIGSTPDAAGLAAETDWVRDLYRELAPHAIPDSGYVNAMVADDAARVPGVYGARYARLARIKAAVDPDNVFRRNANIVPAS